MPRKVAFIIGSFDGGGTEHYLVRLLRGLDRERFEPVVVTLSNIGPLRDEVHRLAPVYVVQLAGKLFNRQGRRELWRLRKMLRREAVSLVHVLIERAVVYGGIAGLIARVPVVASQRNTRSTMGSGLTFLYLLTLRHVARHIIPNAYQVEQWLRAQGVRGTPVTVVHNGIPSERLRPVAERPVDASPVVICSVGRLASAVKGQPLLLEAVQALLRAGKSVRLLIVGSGPDEARLRERAGQLGVAEQVEWTGYLPDPMEAIERSDICVLASYNEGFPNVVVEYFAAGRPVVATAVGGVPEIVRQGENGLLVPPGSAGALSEALARLVDDSELRRRMGRNGRALVERELTVDVEVGRTQEVYDRVLRERGKR